MVRDGDKVFTVRWRAEDYKKLQELSERECRPMSQIIVLAIREWWDRSEAERRLEDE